jgi:hypothetical protein
VPTQTSQSSCLGEHLRILDPLAYAYLLGMYLGDGCISHCPRDVASVIHVAADVAGLRGASPPIEEENARD